MYKLTCSLLNSWQYATDPDAGEEAFASFLATLERAQWPKTQAMKTGIAFEDMVTAAANGTLPAESCDRDAMAAKQFAARVGRGVPQIKATKATNIGKTPVLLVGVADWIGAGIITDIKRVQRYEYGKYQHSTQHPMYLELFPEAMRFDYLIYDGAYSYIEQYRRGDYLPLEATAKRFFDYLEDSGLIDIYQKHWEV